MTEKLGGEPPQPVVQSRLESDGRKSSPVQSAATLLNELDEIFTKEINRWRFNASVFRNAGYKANAAKCRDVATGLEIGLLIGSVFVQEKLNAASSTTDDDNAAD